MAKRPCRSLEQTAQILRVFVEHCNRPPGAREWGEADGERVMIGPWLCEARSQRNVGRLTEEQSHLMAEILQTHRSVCEPE
ncbi:hypothetical protein SGFS_008230 [Streptomyces graminofaciens]|uniref:Helicase-associated domain-containing protein n=1 Tax=Streptomyces graminofaciens TaxID=68212 RepID=A0ABN5V978_9ACTN|nr:hypothetical protein [Streptomyces graminofaciens]BBC29529.1 hypothetical protein SGFS_008230 [Streptomyces graminofaciens]